MITVYDRLFGEADTYIKIRQACADGLRTTAIVASTDRHALGALAALSDEQLNVPRDVSVVGFDDYVTSGFIRPALTMMRTPAAEMGRRATTLLTDLLNGKSAEGEIFVESSLVARSASGTATRRM